jgi:hypothetical protein
MAAYNGRHWSVVDRRSEVEQICCTLIGQFRTLDGCDSLVEDMACKSTQDRNMQTTIFANDYSLTWTK